MTLIKNYLTIIPGTPDLIRPADNSWVSWNKMQKGTYYSVFVNFGSGTIEVFIIENVGRECATHKMHETFNVNIDSELKKKLLSGNLD